MKDWEPIWRIVFPWPMGAQLRLACSCLTMYIVIEIPLLGLHLAWFALNFTLPLIGFLHTCTYIVVALCSHSPQIHVNRITKLFFFHYSYFLWNWHCDTDDGQWMKPINCTILFFVYCSLPLRMPRDILLLLFSSTMTWLGSILHLVTQLQFQHYWLVVSAHSHSSLIISVSENGQILLLIPQLVKSPRLVPTFIITLTWHHHSIMHHPLCGYLYVTTPICILSQMYIHSAFDVANDGALPRGHPGY